MSDIKCVSLHRTRRKWNFQLLSIGSNLCLCQYFPNIYATFEKTNSLTFFPSGQFRMIYLLEVAGTKHPTNYTQPRAEQCEDGFIKMEVVCCLQHDTIIHVFLCVQLLLLLLLFIFYAFRLILRVCLLLLLLFRVWRELGSSALFSSLQLTSADI